MLELTVHAKPQRSILPWRGNMVLEATISASKLECSSSIIPVGPFLERLVSDLPQDLPPLKSLKMGDNEGRNVLSVENVRGRPYESFKSGQTTSATTPENGTREEELFHSSGKLIHPPANLEDYPDDFSDLKREPFEYSLNSKFESITQRGSISHTIEKRAYPSALSSAIPAQAVSKVVRAVPLELDCVRVGFELYRKSRLGGMFGLFPYVWGRFFLEITPQEISFLVEDETAPGSEVLPLAGYGIYQAFDSALESLNLMEQFANRLRTQAFSPA